MINNILSPGLWYESKIGHECRYNALFLTWHDHIEQLQSEIEKRLGVLKRITHLIPVYARRIYVSTIIIPILEYASIVWGDSFNGFYLSSSE